MIENFPAPLTPPDCDLRDFPFLPLDVVRLRDSDIAATPDAECFRAAVLAWAASWHQVPAASLPDDDAAIARLIGMGRDVRGFRKLRETGAMHGFVKCSDGRLYHRVVAEKALTAWEAKHAQRDRTEKARQARLLQLQSQKEKKSVTDTVTSSVVSVTQPSKGEVRDRDSEGIKKQDTTLRAVVPSKPKVEIPEWIPRPQWDAFIEMRSKTKAKPTEHGILLLIAKLRKMRASEDIGAVLDQSTMHNWKGVFPVKHDTATNGNRGKTSNPHDNFNRGIALFIANCEDAEPEREEEAGLDADAIGLPLLAP